MRLVRQNGCFSNTCNRNQTSVYLKKPPDCQKQYPAALFTSTDERYMGTVHCFPLCLLCHLYCGASQCNTFFEGNTNSFRKQ